MLVFVVIVLMHKFLFSLGGDFPNRYFSFNVSSLDDSDNTTLVQVAVATRSRRHSACHVGLDIVQDSSIGKILQLGRHPAFFRQPNELSELFSWYQT